MRIRPKCLIVLFVSFLCSSSLADEILLATGADYAPFIDAASPEGGMYHDIIARAYGAVGDVLKIERFPWKRAYYLVQEGEFVGTFSWGWVDGRDREFHVSDPIYKLRQGLFGHAKDNVYESLQHFQANVNRKSLCLPLGWTLSPALSALVESKQLTLIESSSMVVCFKLLARNRVDFIQAELLSGRYMLKKVVTESPAFSAGARDIAALANIVFEESTAHVLFTKKTPEGLSAVSRFNRGLSKIAESGVLETIIERHRQVLDF